MFGTGGTGRGYLGGDGGAGVEAEGAIRRPHAKARAVELGQIHHQGG